MANVGVGGQRRHPPSNDDGEGTAGVTMTIQERRNSIMPRATNSTDLRTQSLERGLQMEIAQIESSTTPASILGNDAQRSFTVAIGACSQQLVIHMGVTSLVFNSARRNLSGTALYVVSNDRLPSFVSSSPSGTTAMLSVGVY